VFADGLTVGLLSPLPPLRDPVTIDAAGSKAKVEGSPLYDCSSPQDYALTFKLIGSEGSSVRRLPIHNVCGRAIESSLSAPTGLKIGPRRSDGSMPISGTATGDAVELFIAPGGTVQNEALSLLGQVAPVGGSFEFTPTPELSQGTYVTATQRNVSKTSPFAPQVKAGPDVTSPKLLRGVGVGPSTLRLDFDEPISPGSVAPGDFVVNMGGLERPVSAVTVDGSPAFLTSSLAWRGGEAGSARAFAPGPVTDLVGNETLGAPVTRVVASPGDFEKPVISQIQVSPKSFCLVKGFGCRARSAGVIFYLSEPAEVVFRMFKIGSSLKQVVRFRRNLGAGRQQVLLRGKMSGKRLRSGDYSLDVTPIDAPRNVGERAFANFEIAVPKKNRQAPKPGGSFLTLTSLLLGTKGWCPHQILQMDHLRNYQRSLVQ